MPYKDPDKQREFWRVYRRRQNARRRLLGLNARGTPLKPHSGGGRKFRVSDAELERRMEDKFRVEGWDA